MLISEQDSKKMACELVNKLQHLGIIPLVDQAKRLKAIEIATDHIHLGVAKCQYTYEVCLSAALDRKREVGLKFPKSEA